MGEEKGEDDDEEVEIVTTTLLLFSHPTLSATSCLVLAGVHMAHIPGFGQTRQLIVMTAAPQQAVTVATPWQHGLRSPPVRPAVGFAMGFARVATPSSREYVGSC